MPKIELVGEERWSTHSVFNSNAFPVGLEPNVEACSTKAAIHLVHLNMVKEAVKKNYKDFQKELKLKITSQYVASLKKSHSDPVIVYYDGLDYLAALYGFLNSLKSFLDVYATLICRTIQPSLGKKSFKRGMVGGKRIAGGAVVRWLKGSGPKTFKNSSKLQRAIENHSNNWITEAVNHRDILSHQGDIKEMEHMHFILNPPSYRYPGILPPLMPDGQLVVDYCSELLSKLKKFVEESMILLPNIKKKNITFTNFLILGRKNS